MPPLSYPQPILLYKLLCCMLSQPRWERSSVQSKFSTNAFEDCVVQLFDAPTLPCGDVVACPLPPPGERPPPGVRERPPTLPFSLHECKQPPHYVRERLPPVERECKQPPVEREQLPPVEREGEREQPPPVRERPPALEHEQLPRASARAAAFCRASARATSSC